MSLTRNRAKRAATLLRAELAKHGLAVSAIRIYPSLAKVALRSGSVFDVPLICSSKDLVAEVEAAAAAIVCEQDREQVLPAPVTDLRQGGRR